MSAPALTSESLLLRPGNVLQRVRIVALVLGLVGAVLTVLGVPGQAEQFFQSYLIAYLFWSGIGFGSLAILMLYHVTGGAWGAVVRRSLEAASRTIPLLALLFVPLLFGLEELYEWARPEAVAHDPALQHKSAYLNEPFFVIRAAVFFAIWILLSGVANSWSRQQDRTGDPKLVRKLQLLGRGGFLLYAFTMTFASIDWAMSLEPHWFSTIFGVLFMGGQVLTAFAFMIPVLAFAFDREPLTELATPEHFHDLGKLLLAVVMLWTYFAFSQFLIIWSGNLPEEIPWYIHRLEGGWQWVGLAIIVFHFFLPFGILLSRDVKRNLKTLAGIAGAIVVMRLVDTFYTVTPAFHPGEITLHWLDVAAVVGIGGIWVFAFLRQLEKEPLLPIHDPSLPGEE